MKEQIISILIDPVPIIHDRIIDENNDNEEIKKSKKEFPFELCRTIKIFIKTNIREFSFYIYNGYFWNGADIPKFFWRIIGSRFNPEFEVASLLHDYLLQFKKFIIKEVLFDMITINEYRRLTSLIFREKLKTQGTNIIKANIMSWCVDVYQHYFNRKGWKIE